MAVLQPGVLLSEQSLGPLVDPATYTFRPRDTFPLLHTGEVVLTGSWTDFGDTTLTHPNATSGYRQADPTTYTFRPPDTFPLLHQVEPSLLGFTDYLDTTLTHPDATSGYRQVDPATYQFVPRESVLLGVTGQQGACLEHGDI